MPPASGWSRRPRVLLGLVLVAAGLAVLGYLGWQLFVTSWIAERDHDRTVSALEQRWVEGARVARVPSGTATAVMRVPRFGNDFALPILEGTSDEALAGGMGHFAGSAGPGEVGNFALAGHRITHGEPLRAMPELQPGDEVVVDTAEATYTYVLDTGGEDLSVPFTSSWVVEPRPRNPDPDGVGPAPRERRLLTLATCAELFATDQRLVAFGHLVDVEETAG